LIPEFLAERMESSQNNNHPSWSNRILWASAVGILFLTLYPFRPDFARKPAGGGNPFLLGRSQEAKGSLGIVLNVLLFVPFGFGFSEKLHERGVSRKAAMLLALAAGAAFSYGIEFAQIYIPPRDSGWLDVFTNSAGSAAGFLLFEILGARAIGLLSRAEERLRRGL
jgi:VanZ family protein